MKTLMSSLGQDLWRGWLCWPLLLMLGIPPLGAGGLPAAVGERSPIQPASILGRPKLAPLPRPVAGTVESVLPRMHDGAFALNAERLLDGDALSPEALRAGSVGAQSARGA